jgi:hypothetical protein
MTTPEWLKPGIYGAVIGAVFLGVVGFSWGGWMTGGSAEKMAMSRSRDAVTTALVPICLDLSMRDPGKAEKLATIKAADVYRRGQAVMDAGWATVPGDDQPNSDLARACINNLGLDS